MHNVHVIASSVSPIIHTCNVYPSTTLRHAHGSLKRTLARIEQDLTVKETSLSLDRQCVEVRGRLSEYPKAHELAQPGKMAAPKEDMEEEERKEVEGGRLEA